MQVDLITEANSDLTVVNAARCSFAATSTFDYECDNRAHLDTNAIYPCNRCSNRLKPADIKLINYLATHQHWTPFAHPQEVFSLNLTDEEELYFFEAANLSGFEWICKSRFMLRGSLYAYLTNYHYLPDRVALSILYHFYTKYPVSTLAITNNHPLPQHSPQCTHIPNHTTPHKELNHYTLRITCPIFVKRQLETHRRNFVMTDMCDFVQNEVSRRYIQTDPVIYTPPKWRIQHPNKKQGSTDETLDSIPEILTNSNYNHHTYNSVLYYKKFNEMHIAHEQSRMILPLSTYTTFWWTGSVKSWERVFTLRLDEHTQSETRDIVKMCKEVISNA